MNKPSQPHYDRGGFDSIDNAMILVYPKPSGFEKCRTTGHRSKKRGPPRTITMHISHTGKLFAMLAIRHTLRIVQTPRRRTSVETPVYPLCVGALPKHFEPRP